MKGYLVPGQPSPWPRHKAQADFTAKNPVVQVYVEEEEKEELSGTPSVSKRKFEPGETSSWCFGAWIPYRVHILRREKTIFVRMIYLTRKGAPRGAPSGPNWNRKKETGRNAPKAPGDPATVFSYKRRLHWSYFGCPSNFNSMESSGHWSISISSSSFRALN
ncbi:hypothetical protein RUM43_002062 [Polyplax serrata]|uniref:Uncharacterized protein n=1 Tax=Polyplax serrata TaxID=468196 RepID=A0AAN8S2F7_POLSC